MLMEAKHPKPTPDAIAEWAENALDEDGSSHWEFPSEKPGEKVSDLIRATGWTTSVLNSNHSLGTWSATIRAHARDVPRAFPADERKYHAES